MTQTNLEASEASSKATPEATPQATPKRGAWFKPARYGLFMHWGPYAAYGRGEQVLFREHMDPRQYEIDACAWNPSAFDAKAWAASAKEAGMKYAVLTARHHDGYCLWDSKQTDYTSVQQAPGRDFVAEYVAAFREAGIKVGLYYSLLDWRIPACWEGPEHAPKAWAEFKDYYLRQIEELLTNYGDIAVLWFDGSWPHDASVWGAEELMALARKLQPEMMVNNRMGTSAEVASLGDFGTPEQHIKAESSRPWESCQTASMRLWGYGENERYRSTEQLLDTLCQVTQQGGNLLLNVGPDGEGRFPQPFKDRIAAIGEWLKIHRPAIEATDHGPDGLTEPCSYGYQTAQGNNLYLILRFWPNEPVMRLADIESKLIKAELMTTGQALQYEQIGNEVKLSGLPKDSPIDLFPVIRLVFDGPPQTNHWGRTCRMWQGDALDRVAWAQLRGSSVNAYRDRHHEPYGSH